MTEQVLLPGDVIANSEQELPQDILRIKRAVEEKFALEIMPDHFESLRVNAEHQSIWAPREPLAVPSEFTETGRKA